MSCCLPAMARVVGPCVCKEDVNAVDRVEPKRMGHGLSLARPRDEWSAVWGGGETHWFATVLPRIRKFLPAEVVVEIAPGYGRWTGYLLPLSSKYIGVDLAESCVAACKKRFAAAENASFFTNDGRSADGCRSIGRFCLQFRFLLFMSRLTSSMLI
jgi:SAM-dependent methyltransferase